MNLTQDTKQDRPALSPEETERIRARLAKADAERAAKAKADADEVALAALRAVLVPITTQQALSAVQNLRNVFRACEYAEAILVKVASAEQLALEAERRTAELRAGESAWLDKITAAEAAFAEKEREAKDGMDRVQAEYARFSTDVQGYKAQVQAEITTLEGKRDALAVAVKNLQDSLKQAAVAVATA